MRAPMPRRIVPLSAWPEADRSLWAVGLTSAYAMSLKPKMLDAIADGYGCWLGVLAELGLLDHGQHPADRVTAAAVDRFLDLLRKRGNALRTIRARLSHLGMALRILAPHLSFTWLHPRKLLLLGEPPATRPSDQWASWPVIDRQCWERGLIPGDLLDEPNYASKLRPATLKSIITGYRRWLVFLQENNLLDPAVRPAERVTRVHVRAYFRHLRDTQSNASVIQRMSELRQAMRIMHPDMDFRWLTSPGGRSLATLLPIVPKPVRIIDSKVLYEWGVSMMQDALQMGDPEHRRIAYRNGLLIAIFAARAPRVASMACLRLGESVLRNGNAFRLVFAHEDIKTRRHLEYDTPAGLTSAIDHYITVIRAELVHGPDHGWFWVNQYGEALSKGEIGDMIQRKSKETFGKGFGPHRFRHALGTTAPLADPAHPGVAAAVLGITGRMVEQHYNRATQADVAAKFNNSLDQARTEHRTIAGREFGWERDE